MISSVAHRVTHNGLPLAAGGDLEALNCQPALKLNRSTNLQLTTSPPLAANGCACCTTQIYKNLYKNWIFRKFKYARKEEFYAPIICFG